MTNLESLTDEELLQWVDRQYPEVAELAARLEQRIHRHTELIEDLDEFKSRITLNHDDTT